jgi:hypothetical protein
MFQTRESRENWNVLSFVCIHLYIKSLEHRQLRLNDFCFVRFR